MSRIWKPQPKEVIQSWIDAINDEASDDLTDWEINFIESCQKGLHRFGALTQPMEDKLESIYANKTK